MPLATTGIHADLVLPDYFKVEWEKRSEKFVTTSENESVRTDKAVRLACKVTTEAGAKIDSCTWEHYGLWSVDLFVPKDTSFNLYEDHLRAIEYILEDDSQLYPITTESPATTIKVGINGVDSFQINVSINFSFLRERIIKVRSS